MPVGCRFLPLKCLPTRLTTAAHPGTFNHHHGSHINIRRAFSSGGPTRSLFSALARKSKLNDSEGDISIPPSDGADIGVHEQSEHAVISAFDLFSIGGELSPYTANYFRMANCTVHDKLVQVHLIPSDLCEQAKSS